MELKGIFKKAYGNSLRGKGWINCLQKEDKDLLIHVGLAATDYGRLGGQARAETAKRDSRGHFCRADGTNRDLDRRRILGSDYEEKKVEAKLSLGEFEW